ncbi:MAG: phytanoyl-CoA dioxygenase family protein, partial [Gammaproteobacteria bacterium]|nr:phytanoyl-CoA dioxygenase family protein [Gammaproteobacteria bacterium]
PYFHVIGEKCCTVSIPLDAVNADNGMMAYVRGSHRWQRHAPNGFVTPIPLYGTPLPKLPDIEGDNAGYDIVHYATEPGDIIVHHANTVHSASGNTTDRDRRAHSLHYLGDDVRYRERQGMALDLGKSPTLKEGDRMDSEELPLVWSREQGYVAA